MEPTLIYSLRNVNLLEVPKSILDIVAAMQLTPVEQVYTKKPQYKKHSGGGGGGGRAERDPSWRQALLVEMKRTEFKHDDPDFEAAITITNRVASATIVPASAEMLAILTKRGDDEAFRLRLITMLFDRGVSMPFFSKLIANMFEILYKDLPVIKEDLHFSCSVDSFNKMFDMSEVLVCPSTEDPDYDDKLCAWNKKKEIRRGFGMFVTELHIRGLVDEDIILGAIKSSMDELDDMIRKPADKALSEAVDQHVTFLFESAKVLSARFGKTHQIVKMLAAKGAEIYKIPKPDTPCLGMRSRFKLDDISKL